MRSAQDGVVVFAHVLGWPEEGLVQLGSVSPNPAIKVKVHSDSCDVTVIQNLLQKIALEFQVLIKKLL